MKCKIERTTDPDGPVTKSTVLHCSLCDRWLSLAKHFPFKDAVKFGRNYGWFVRADIIICPHCLFKLFNFTHKNTLYNPEISWSPIEYNHAELIEKIIGER